MTEPKPNPEPRGFSEHTRKVSGENAHQQGWGRNEDERRRLPEEKKDYAKPAANTAAERAHGNTSRRTGT